MNLKVMRNIHLYLGVFFAPLLIFFIITGALQTFGLHEASDDGSYKPPAIIKSLASVHKDQRWVDHYKKPASSVPFQYLVLLMSIGVFVTTVLGIVMAFKYTKPWLVWFWFVGGFILPVFLIYMAYRS